MPCFALSCLGFACPALPRVGLPFLLFLCLPFVYDIYPLSTPPRPTNPNPIPYLSRLQVMISDETITVTLEEAVENQLLRSGSPAAAAATAVGSEDGVNLYWETVERHVAAEDYTPLLGLVAELRDKIIGLTPRRRDLAAETCEAMDVELLEQMVEYGAFDVVSVLFVMFC